MHQGDCYGDGTVYRGQRSADSATRTYTVEELARAKGVPEVVGSAMIAISKDCMACQEKLHALKYASKLMNEAMTDYHQQYPHMVKGYVLDAMSLLREVLKEIES